jgi:Tfp pilus assembly protein PilV
MKIKSTSGQSLIELLTALAVVLLVIVALVRATTISLRSSSFSKAQSQATAYAQEAIEWVRAERDKDWDEFSTRAGVTFCLNSEPVSWLSEGICSADDYTLGGRFKREATLTSVDGEVNQVEVRVVVSWLESGGEHQSQITTYLTNWR